MREIPAIVCIKTLDHSSRRFTQALTITPTDEPRQSVMFLQGPKPIHTVEITQQAEQGTPDLLPFGFARFAKDSSEKSSFQAFFGGSTCILRSSNVSIFGDPIPVSNPKGVRFFLYSKTTAAFLWEDHPNI